MLDAFVKPAIAGLAMGSVLALGQRYFGEGVLVLAICLLLVSRVCYVGVLFVARAFSKAELLLAKEALIFLGPYLRSIRQKPGTLS